MSGGGVNDAVLLRLGARRSIDMPPITSASRSRKAKATSATSSAITSADSPVVLRSLMIAARDSFPITRPWSGITIQCRPSNHARAR